MLLVQSYNSFSVLGRILASITVGENIDDIHNLKIMIRIRRNVDKSGRTLPASRHLFATSVPEKEDSYF